MIGMGSQSLILVYSEQRMKQIMVVGGEIRETTIPQGKSHKQIYPAFCYHLSGIYSVVLGRERMKRDLRSYLNFFEFCY